MTDQELEAYDAMMKDRDHWKSRFKKLDKELMCELRDPNGTIWEHAKKLQDELVEAWTIINTLNMGELDRGESWPRANFWIRENQRYAPKGILANDTANVRDDEAYETKCSECGHTLPNAPHP